MTTASVLASLTWLACAVPTLDATAARSLPPAQLSLAVSPVRLPLEEGEHGQFWLRIQNHSSRPITFSDIFWPAFELRKGDKGLSIGPYGGMTHSCPPGGEMTRELRPGESHLRLANLRLNAGDRRANKVSVDVTLDLLDVHGNCSAKAGLSAVTSVEIRARGSATSSPPSHVPVARPQALHLILSIDEGTTRGTANNTQRLWLRVVNKGAEPVVFSSAFHVKSGFWEGDAPLFAGPSEAPVAAKCPPDPRRALKLLPGETFSRTLDIDVTPPHLRADRIEVLMTTDLLDERGGCTGEFASLRADAKVRFNAGP
jgi:hypothetical protein